MLLDWDQAVCNSGAWAKAGWAAVESMNLYRFATLGEQGAAHSPARAARYAHRCFEMCMIVVSFYDVRKDTCRSSSSNGAFAVDAVELSDLFPIC